MSSILSDNRIRDLTFLLFFSNLYSNISERESTFFKEKREGYRG